MGFKPALSGFLYFPIGGDHEYHTIMGNKHLLPIKPTAY